METAKESKRRDRENINSKEKMQARARKKHSAALPGDAYYLSVVSLSSIRVRHSCGLCPRTEMQLTEIILRDTRPGEQLPKAVPSHCTREGDRRSQPRPA